MINRKPLFVAIVVSCGLVGIAINHYLSSSEQKTTVAQEEVEQSVAGSTSANDSGFPQIVSSTKKPGVKQKVKVSENYNYIQDRLDIMRERRPNDVYDEKAVAEAVARTDAWTPLKEIPKDLPLNKEDLADGREFIKFDNLKLETLVPGDNLRLAIKETGQQYDVNIDDVETLDENRTTWRGHIEGTDGHNYEVSLTHGPKLTVGGIDTPDGQYIVQANGENGWVASSARLFKRHVDPIDPKDVIAAEEHQH